MTRSHHDYLLRLPRLLKRKNEGEPVELTGSPSPNVSSCGRTVSHSHVGIVPSPCTADLQPVFFLLGRRRRSLFPERHTHRQLDNAGSFIYLMLLPSSVIIYALLRTLTTIFSIVVPVLLWGLVREGIPAFCFQFGGARRKSENCSLSSLI